MEKKVGTRQNKRRMPAITLPEISTRQCLVLYPHGENSAFLRIVYDTILPKVWTKDKPCASFLLRNKIIHSQMAFGLTDSRQGACVATSVTFTASQQKTQSAGLWASLFLNALRFNNGVWLDNNFL